MPWGLNHYVYRLDSKSLDVVLMGQFETMEAATAKMKEFALANPDAKYWVSQARP